MSMPSATRLLPELWAGAECTVNRVGNEFFDQLTQTGHATRVTDLDLFAELGIKALRYPILWERIAPDGLERADWTWADERLTRLRELQIRPIVGLVHHGSGPRHTSLIDPSFASGLADFARAVAERYPWIEDYTPVNEPLTTARFSGLYGHWYPHGRDGLTFARALLSECRAVALAMRAIRDVCPTARLVQTEDLGKTFSTPSLAYQADFENNRRWATFDLLCGRIDHNHPFWDYLRSVGVAEAEITWFLDHACPPDILGLNYYLTSERFLDHDYQRYPEQFHGSNSRHTYADVEAVRVRAVGPAGAGALLQEAWERYRLPIAVTEVHNGCTREEQLRWFMEVWNAARELRTKDVDIRAVTAWSLLGAYDWNTLVTRVTGHYEPGVFDLRAPNPRPTALAGLLRDLGAGREPRHPLLAIPGWWRRPERLIYAWTVDDIPEDPGSRPQPTAAGVSPARLQPILIIGATPLGRGFADLCAERGIPARLVSTRELDIVDPTAVAAALQTAEPWAIINTTQVMPVDAAERDPAACFREHTDGPAVLAAECARRDIPLLTFSSDFVFDGAQDVPYVESDAVAPLNVLGHALATADVQVLNAMPTALVVRTGELFGRWTQEDFVRQTLRALAHGQPVVAMDDVVISPTYLPDLAHACLDLLIDAEQGLWHLANKGATTWADLARRAAELTGLDARRVEGRPAEALGLPARRAPYGVLGSERGILLPPLDDALPRYIHECDLRAVARA